MLFRNNSHLMVSWVDNETTSGALFDVTGGWVAQTRWQRSGGHGFPTNKPYTIEDVFAKWGEITTFGT
jgi:multifunctional beta-oxidation protein